MKSSLSIWHLLHNVKLRVNILSIFVAFLDNTNFKIQILNGVSSSKFSLNSELRNVHCSALPSHVCLYKTWWKYWKVSMRNPIETDFDVSLVSWFLTLKPDWPKYKLSNMFVMFFLLRKNVIWTWQIY